MPDADQPITLDDELWERVTEITGGATSACYQCGACTAACPWGLVRGEPLNVRMMVRRAQLGLDGAEGSDIWLCTSCRQCVALCPRGVDVPEVFRSLRAAAWQDRQVPAGLPSLLWDVQRDGNPWGQPPSQRFDWARDLELEPYNDEHELLLYIGCSSSYDRRLQKVARALVTILRAAGVSFGVLGEREPCCGEAVLAVGQHRYLERIIEENMQLFGEVGATDVVTVSPHCFDVFSTHYPQGGGFQPRHYTQLLAELVDAGRLELSSDEPFTVTYQDPCFLGRGHGVYEEPRNVLSAIAGAELREMDDNRDQALCCGGGGGRMWVETAPEDRFGLLRVRQAAATGAEVLATACPACLSCLEDGLKVAGTSDLRVMDIAELVASALVPASEPVAAEVGGVAR